MYKAKVKYNGNHYDAGQEVRGSKIAQYQDGTVELLNDEPIEEFPFYGEGRNEWVEVDVNTIVNDSHIQNSSLLALLQNIAFRYADQGFDDELKSELQSLIKNGKILGYTYDMLVGLVIDVEFENKWRQILFNRFGTTDLESQLLGD